MKTTQALLAAVTLSAGLIIATSAQAALLTRLGGQAVYDTDLDITWLANANVIGYQNWYDASAWAAGLSVDGFTGWRLPNANPSCISSLNCTDSEMGHLFYNELGGVAGSSILTTNNANLSLFQNLQANNYWSATQLDTSSAMNFYFGNGIQNAWLMTNGQYALAVRPGDVTAVPVPAAAWLFGSGLLGLIGVTRRKTA